MAYIPLVLPNLGEGVYGAKIQSWLKKPGDKVLKDETIFEVATDKADLEIPSPETGYLREIVALSGKEVRIKEVVAILTTSRDEDLPTEKAPSSQEDSSSRSTTPSPTTTDLCRPKMAPSLTSPGTHERLWLSPTKALSPYVKTLARQQGLSIGDLNKIKGTGAEGRVVAQDIKRAALLGEHVSPTKTMLSPQRKIIATHLVASLHQRPHLTTFRDIDFLTPLNLKKKKPVSIPHLSITAMILYGVAQVIRRHHLLLSSLKENEVTSYQNVNLGIVLALSDHLLVPVIRNADHLNLHEIAEKLYELTQKARSGKLSSSDLTGGTFTITNPGMYGCQASTAVIFRRSIGYTQYWRNGR